LPEADGLDAVATAPRRCRKHRVVQGCLFAADAACLAAPALRAHPRGRAAPGT